jgi:hypothetical protein
MELDKLTQIQKASINYNSSPISLMKREYEKARKEVYENEHNNSRGKHISREQSSNC